tara:strand:- start:17 stop:646 length:630 start_codon:yes stop_codon:yes gene_type:complete
MAQDYGMYEAPAQDYDDSNFPGIGYQDVDPSSPEFGGLEQTTASPYNNMNHWNNEIANNPGLKNYINLSQSIDVDNPQSRLDYLNETFGAVPAKTFNTPKSLMEIPGATKEGFFGTGLSAQGKALEEFRNSAVNFKNAEANKANTPQTAFNFMTERPGLYGDVIKNKSFIQNAINQGFLQTEEDYENQVPLGEISLKDGGLASMFVNKR